MNVSVSLAIILVTAFPQVTVQKASDHGYAESSGTVKDVIGARIVGASVEFTSKTSHYSLTTGSDGTYSARLTPGIYSVTATKASFCDGHRASFSIVANQKVEIDFVLPYNMQASDGGFPRAAGCYNEDEPSMPRQGELRPLVLYGDREEKSSGEIVYSSLKRCVREYQSDTTEERYPAIFTYDLLTLKADTLIFKPRDKSITGIGNVTLQNGTETQRGSTMTIRFRDGRREVK
ncbi:MAG: carboxypeptidase-like regulatory domain-containing protein [Candidatus Acidiferrales bacterium]